MNMAVIAQTALPTRAQAASIGLWFFIGVVCALFALFFAAYVMRLEGEQGYPLALPWQFGLSSALLAGASLGLEAARRGRGQALALALLLGLGFVLSQLWAWGALQAAQVGLRANPAASFLYLLTGLHGLHVLGGLAALALAWREPGAPWRIALCARYWHTLLLLWLGLYVMLSRLTPDLVLWLCGRAP